MDDKWTIPIVNIGKVKKETYRAIEKYASELMSKDTGIETLLQIKKGVLDAGIDQAGEKDTIVINITEQSLATRLKRRLRRDYKKAMLEVAEKAFSDWSNERTSKEADKD